MSRLIVRLFVLLAVLMPLAPALAQVGPMRGAPTAPRPPRTRAMARCAGSRPSSATPPSSFAAC
ncbi:hypothetical protein [Elstera litoralis]|uniref:hypothetical protein n=1 Tax=Elstera litoralis TaxID=552518 RepID=UPI0012ED65B6|nr:hypothetical protein [Elstera litoralis]